MIRLTTTNNEEIYINRLYIVMLQQETSKTVAISMTDGVTYYVKDHVDRIINLALQD